LRYYANNLELAIDGLLRSEFLNAPPAPFQIVPKRQEETNVKLNEQIDTTDGLNYKEEFGPDNDDEIFSTIC
jgi:hypothetical protein